MNVSCPRCDRPLEHARLVAGPQTCPLCRGRFEAVRFDPPAASVSVLRLAEARPEAATPCPMHPGNAAEVHCARCGVFTCGLCRVELSDRALCPACFERLAAAGELPEILTSYRDYGRAQRLLVALGVLVLVTGPVAGPASIYYGLKALEQRRRAGEPGAAVGVWVSFVLGMAVTAGGIGVFVWLVR